jgi:hypothetical protein
MGQLDTLKFGHRYSVGFTFYFHTTFCLEQYRFEP